MKKILGLLLLASLLMMGCVEEEKTYEGTVVVYNNVDSDIDVTVDGRTGIVGANSSRNFTVELENSSDEESFQVRYKISGRDEFMSQWVILSSGEQRVVDVNPGINSTMKIDYWSQIAGLQGYFAGNYFDIDYWGPITYTIDMLENETTDFSVNYYGRFVFEVDDYVAISENEDLVLNVYPDCGEIVVENTSNSFTITEVYISASSDTSWGTNDLAGTIGPGESVVWKADAGNWDIKLVDDWGDEFVAYENYLGIEETVTYTYDGFRESRATGDTDAAKAENAANFAGERTAGRLEQVK
ncbi:MAG: hypothetical protein R6U84_08540, partial [Candidatus Cloacimonadales bacterium]